MKLQFVEQSEGFRLCHCNGHDYQKDFQRLPAAWLTVEGTRFCARENENVPYLIQFPYKYSEWYSGHVEGHYCPKCGTIPYRIIKNKDYIANKS
jgi:hypothetical protein